MDWHKLINDLGGMTAVSRALGIKNACVVGNWHLRGIPWRWRPAVAKLAADKGIEVPADFLIAGPRAA